MNEPIPSEWRAQLQGALTRRQGLSYIGNRPYEATWAAQVRWTHGWMTLHQACDCRYSIERGRTA